MFSYQMCEQRFDLLLELLGRGVKILDDKEAQ